MSTGIRWLVPRVCVWLASTAVVRRVRRPRASSLGGIKRRSFLKKSVGKCLKISEKMQCQGDGPGHPGIRGDPKKVVHREEVKLGDTTLKRSSELLGQECKNTS